MFGLGWPELILILAIVLLLFGGSRLKDLAKGVGEAVREFKKASSEQPSKDDEEKTIIEAAKKMGIKTEGRNIKEILSEMSKTAEEKS